MDEPDPKSVPASAHAFRTYASDLARLGGKKDAKPVPAPAPSPNTPAAPKHASAHPAGVPTTSAAPTPVPSPVTIPLPPEAAVQTHPYEPPPASIIPKAPSTSESREEILARLKARVAPAAPAPQPFEPAPPTVLPKAPSTDEKREEVLARLRGKTAGTAPVASAPPAPIRPSPIVRPAPLPSAAPSPLHTYKTDFSDKTKKEGASPISVLAAEQNAGPRAPLAPKESSKSRVLLIIGSIILILAGGASVFFAYQFATGRPLAPLAVLVPSLIFGDRHEEISGEGAELRGALTGLGGELSEGEVAIAYVTTASTTPKGTTVMVPAEGGALIEALGLSAPSIVLRNILNESTVGVVRAEGEARPFFILRVTSYERTFAGMLSWEPTMARDLGAFYPAYPESAAVGTSSAPSVPSPGVRPVFEDEILENHDVRVLRDGEDRALIIYGYRDKETLLIAHNEAAFAELLSRLSATRSQ